MLSDKVPLGKLQENENTTEGIYAIVKDHHKKYVPGHDTDIIMRQVLVGDLFTVERFD